MRGCAFLLLFFANIFYAEDPLLARQKFSELRDRHTGLVAAKAFNAQMTSSTADKLLKNKIKGPYIVDVFYHTEKGLEFFVSGSELFYRDMLSSYASYINQMLFPLLSTKGYMKFQSFFQISEVKESVYEIKFLRGDLNIKYQFTEGDAKLVDHINYFENNKKIFSISITWSKFSTYYIPIKINSVSYEKTRRTDVFEIQNINLL